MRKRAVPVVVTSWQRAVLLKERRSPDGRVSRRAQVVLMARQGAPLTGIASVTGYTEEAIRLIKHRWNERGEDALRDAPRSGRPPKATREYLDVLDRTARTAPSETGYAFGVWSTARLAEHMADRTGVRLCADRVRTLLHEMGLTWKRPAHTTRNLTDPREYERGRKRLAALKRGLSGRTRGTSSGSRTRRSPRSCRTW
jgi:transposase